MRLIRQVKQRVLAALMNQPCTSPAPAPALKTLLSRPPSYASPSTVTFSTMNKNTEQEHLDSVFKQKRALRSRVRKALKAMELDLRSQEDNAIQSIILESPWFQSSRRLCAYISCSALREVDTSKLLSETLSNPTGDGHTQRGKILYVPRVEDKNCRMRMLRISCIDDLVPNSMDILEPVPVDSDGNEREDVMLANEPVDLFLLPDLEGAWVVVEGIVMNPGLSFKLLLAYEIAGAEGSYYDTFLKKYQELAKARDWKQPLLVVLSYSVQIMDEGVIAVTPNDIPVDALVSPVGVIPVSQAALDRMKL